MDHNNDREVLPLCEEILLPMPPYYQDQGDVFQCGRCKQNFYSILEFLSHKKEHSSEQRVCHMVNVFPNNIIALSQPSNEIWILKEDNVEIGECEANLLDTSNTIINFGSREPFVQSDFVVETTENLECKPNSPLVFIADKETVNPLSCSSCGECFESDIELTSHTQSHLSLESVIQEDPTTYTSIDSNLETDSQVTSQPSVESREKYFQCIVCGRIFADKSFLKKHMSTHKVWPDNLGKTLPKDSTTNERSHVCPYCQQIFQTYINLRTHLKEHKHQKVFKCIQENCAAMFVDLESLHSHINVTHDSVVYHCHVCTSVLTSLVESAAHQLTHSVDEGIRKKVYQCVHCKATFKRNYSLKHHLDTVDHVNKCRHCNKCFVSERSLRKHLHLHNESVSYKCDVCSASFKMKHYLSSHLATHSKTKQFSCNMCDKDFKRKDLLLRHSKVHHPDQWKHCPYRSELGCMVEFTRTDKLNQHIVKIHSNKVSVETHVSPLEIIIVPVQGGT